MEALIIVLLVVIIALIISAGSSLSARLRKMEEDIFNLEQYTRAAIKRPAAPVIEKPDIVRQTPQAPVTPEQVKPENTERHKEVITDTRPPVSTPPPPYKPIPNFAPEPHPKPSLFERYPDLEKFIGENLVNKIGIAILVIGIGLFVKFAIDNNWIGPVGRVAIGILCGAILIAIGHYLRNSYKAFSSVLVGGGLAVFYFTITLAFHQFHLFSQTTAFIILIGITVFAVILALLYDKQELAIISLIGGFTSPFMVSTGQANYNALFIYLLILNTGLLVIAYYKAWRILNLLSFIFTVILFLTILFTLSDATYSTGFLFASLFYLLYFVINIAYNIRENKVFIASDFCILLANTALYFAAGLYFLTAMHLQPFRGLFSAGLACINLALSFILFRNKRVDTNILYLLIGITLTFISLTAPIQLHGHYITLFWAAEAVLLYWLYQKSGIALMKLTSALIWFAMLASLMMDLFQIYTNTSLVLPVLANKGFITILCTSISSFLLYLLSAKQGDKSINTGFIVDKLILKITATGLLFLSGYLEVNHQFLTRYPGTSLNDLYLNLYVPVFVLLLNVFSKWLLPTDWRSNLILVVISILILLGFYQSLFELQAQMLTFGRPDPAHFTAHWITAIIIALLFYQLIRLCRANLQDHTLAAWLISLGIVLFLSLEFCLLSNWLFYSTAYPLTHVETIYVKSFLPVLWGLLSFALMWLGMRNKARVLRIISLTLFSITLIKLFTFDISNIPAAGKIIAFLCLGILLLIISFMYQKVKKIIADEKKDD